MGELILCTTSIAANSYYIEEASINVYSLEELSYYIFNNAYLLRDNFVDESLCLWLKNELGLTKLSNELLGFLYNEASLNILVGHLLRYSGYLTKNEVKNTLEIIASFEGKSEAESIKIRADHMINNGRFLDAIFSYENLLSKKVPMEDYLKSCVLHNLGCALCGMFFFSKAAENFEAAYRINREEASLEMLLSSCLFAEDEEKFNMYVDRYQVLPEDAKRIKDDYEFFMNSEENKDFSVNLQQRLVATRDAVERENVYADLVDSFKADYRSLRAF